MERFILIETSTTLCSTALVENGKIVSYKEHYKEHAAMTAPMIQEMLQERSIKVKDCNAVCVTMGPGSYTGLRIGVTHAKALCFGANIPLIAVSSMETLAWQAKDENLISNDCYLIIPMIDARRMEVYCAEYNNDCQLVKDIEAKIIDEHSFIEELTKGKVLFIGDGVKKCKDVITHPNAIFVECQPKASSLLHPAIYAFKNKKFEDVAYFEPLYLKDFIATVSKKKIF